MSIKNSKLKFEPFLAWYFYDYTLNLGIISPIFEAIPKNVLSRMSVNSKNQSPFFKDKKQKKEV